MSCRYYKDRLVMLEAAVSLWVGVKWPSYELWLPISTLLLTPHKCSDQDQIYLRSDENSVSLSTPRQGMVYGGDRIGSTCDPFLDDHPLVTRQRQADPAVPEPARLESRSAACRNSRVGLCRPSDRSNSR